MLSDLLMVAQQVNCRVQLQNTRAPLPSAPPPSSKFKGQFRASKREHEAGQTLWDSFITIRPRLGWQLFSSSKLQCLEIASPPPSCKIHQPLLKANPYRSPSVRVAGLPMALSCPLQPLPTHHPPLHKGGSIFLSNRPSWEGGGCIDPPP